jgi:hypothetical protein
LWCFIWYCAMMMTHKIFDNDVYVLREFARFAIPSYITDGKDRVFNNWLRTPQGIYCVENGKEITLYSEFCISTDLLQCCIRGYMRDDAFGIFVLKFS